jgi:hypothetical protein
MKYVLNGRAAVPEPDTIKWAEWFETAERHVAKDVIGGTEISTVFLGLDHSFNFTGPPVLFETLVIGGELDGEMDRYTSWSEAEIGHRKMVLRVRKGE